MEWYSILTISILVGVIVYFYLSNQSVTQKLEQTNSYVEQLKKCVMNPAESISLDFHKALMNDLKSTLNNSQDLLEQTKAELAKVKNQKISQSVRLGQVSEVLLPFLENFPFDPKSLKPLFQPIDYIAFEDDWITFIEIKTGNSNLTEKQKHIKMLVESGKVRFQIHKLNENGVSVK